MPKPLNQTTASLLLLSMVMLGVFPLDVVLPSFPALASHFETTADDIALSVSLFATVVAVSQLVLGPLSDAIGRKPLLLGGIALAMIGAYGCTQASDYRLFLLFRGVQAAGCGCFVLANALVEDLFSGAQRGRVRILLATAGGVLVALSPLVGAGLQTTFGWAGSFHLFNLVGFLILLQAARHLRPLPASARSHPAFIDSYRPILRSPAFLGYSAIAAIGFACHFSFIVVSPLLLLVQLQLTQLQFALVLLGYGLAYLAGGLVASALHSRLERDMQVMGGIACTVLSGLALLGIYAGSGLSVWGLMLPMVLCATGTTLSRPAATGCAMDLFPGSAGAASSILHSMKFLIAGAASACINLAGESPAYSLGAGLMMLGTASAVIAWKVAGPSRIAAR